MPKVGRWERNAEFWIRIIRDRLDPYRTELTDAAVLRALGPDEYFAPRRVEQRFNVSGLISPAPTVIWVRPLESYFALLADAGFCVERLWEPRPSRRLQADPWWRDNFAKPLFLLWRAVRR